MSTEVIDIVEAKTSSVVDVVDRMYKSGHGRYCDYVPEIVRGEYVYCKTCGSQIACLHPECEEGYR